MLPIQMFPRLPARATFVADTYFVSGTQKMFLILFRNILCPQQMFPSLRSPRYIMGNSVSSFTRALTESLWLTEQGWRSGESAHLPLIRPGFDSWTRRHMWVEFVVGSLLCSERLFSGYSGFPLSLKTNISKFQFDSGMHRHF